MAHFQTRDSGKALQEPANAVGVAFTGQALHAIYALTRGYPYFLQEWAYQSWRLAPESPIGIEVVRDATGIVTSRLDENFFRVRFSRLTPGEKTFLRAMASLGPGPYRTSDVSAALKMKATSLGPTRAQLIRKGMVFSPAHGDLAFTVPLFDEFMIRAMPTFPS